MAICSGPVPPRSANRLPSIRSRGHEHTSDSSGWNRNSTNRSHRGVTPCRRGLPSPAWGPMHRGRHHGGGARRPDARRSSQTIHEILGLLPSEYASGERRQQGSITTAGHTHARRALVEGAWAYATPPTSAGISNADWNNNPKRSRTSAGSPRATVPTLPPPDGRGHMPTGGRGHGP